MPTLADSGRPRPDWPLRLAWLYFSLYVVWAVSMLAGLAPRAVVNDLLFLPLYSFAGVAAWHASRAPGTLPRHARGWQFIALAWFSSGVGAILLLASRAWTASWFETLAWAVYQAYFVLLILGLWRFITLPTGASARFHLAVETLIVAVATVILAWYFIFRFDEAAQSPLRYLKSLLVMSPGELAAAVCAVAIAYRPANDGLRRERSYLSVATLLGVVADFVFENDSLLGPGWGGPTGDALLGVAAVLFVCAARVGAREESGEGASDSLQPAPGPYLAIGVVGILAIYQSWHPDLEHPALSGLVLGGALLLGLMVVRLALAQREFAAEVGARAAQDARFRAMVQRSSDAILVVDSQGDIRYASPPFGAMIGDPAREVAGARLTDLVAFDPPGGLCDWLAGPEARPLARWTIGDRHIEALATDHSADPSIGGIVINARDVTERTRLESRLQQAQKLEAVGRFAASVAHDFNNVLTVLGANLHFLREDADGQHDAEFVQMSAAVDRGAALARQLSALSRPKAPTATATDLSAALRAVERTLRILLPSSIQSEVTAPPSPLIVPLDEVQAEQVLLNLALNSRDAMPESGRLVIHLEPGGAPADVPVEHGQRWARLRVSDTGIGMSPDVMAHALEPFFTTKDESRGSGLGLSSVQAIVSAVGGRVELESALGLGTTVTIWLPVVQAAVAERRPDPDPVPSRTEGRLLVVDDEPSVRHLVARYLDATGCHAIEREDGRAALEYLERNASTVQLVLTDVVMPVMSGQDLASRIAARWPHIQVMFMSGTPHVLDGRHESWASAPVFAKPLDLPAVANRVTASLRRTARRTGATH